jgi:signal peptidase II
MSRTKNTGGNVKLKKQDILFLVILFSLIFLDQITKFLIRLFMTKGQSVSLINNILHITYVQNTGAGFGLFQNSVSILIWLSVLVLGLLLFLYDKIPLIPKSLLIAGVIGNLIDRVFLRFVVDFIDFRIWPAFNVADSCLTIGIIFLIIYTFKNK